MEVLSSEREIEGGAKGYAQLKPFQKSWYIEAERDLINAQASQVIQLFSSKLGRYCQAPHIFGGEILSEMRKELSPNWSSVFVFIGVARVGVNNFKITHDENIAMDPALSYRWTKSDNKIKI
jgi:hypothetical protein